MPEQLQASMSPETIDLARRYEPDRHAAALLRRPPLQAPMLAITAFAAQLTQIRFEQSDAALAQIRLQWWRDVLQDRDADAPIGHPVADAVLGVAITHDIPAGLFDSALTHGQNAVVQGAMGPGALRQNALGQDALGQDALQQGTSERVVGAETSDNSAAPAAPGSSGLAQIMVHDLALLEADIFRLGVHVVAENTAQAAQLGAACMRAGKAYALSRYLFARARIAQATAPADWSPEISDLIAAAHNDVIAARQDAQTAGAQFAPIFHPLALVEPYLRLSKGGGRLNRAALAWLPLRRLWLILLADIKSRR